MSTLGVIENIHYYGSNYESAIACNHALNFSWTEAASGVFFAPKHSWPDESHVVPAGDKTRHTWASGEAVSESTHWLWS